MADALIIVSLVVVLVAGCLGAGLYGNRLKARARNDIELRYLRLRAVLAVYALILPVLVLSAALRHKGSLFERWAAPGCFAVLTAAMVWQFLQARKKYRELPASHRQGLLRETKIFFWQAILILLPVAGLAGFGLYSLRQDRLFAGQEAREAGQILAQRLAQAVRTEGNEQLYDYRNASFDLHANRSADLGLSSWQGGDESESNAWAYIKSWQQENPEIDLYSLPATDGEGYAATQPETMPPQPAEWLGQLKPAQRQLWQSAEADEFAANDFSAAQAALEKFIESEPPAGARANAEYLLLLAKTHGLSDGEALKLLADSSWSQSDQVTDAGLPVGQLIWYQRLRLMANGSGLKRKDLSAIGWAITYRPSLFSTRLIAEMERVCRGTGSETLATTLRAWWGANEKAHQVFEDFCEQYPANTRTNVFCWVDSREGKYLLVLPDPRLAATNQAAPAQISLSGCLLFPQAVIEKALSTAVVKADITFAILCAGRI